MLVPTGVTGGGRERKREVEDDSKLLAWAAGRRELSQLTWGRLKRSMCSILDTLSLR